MQEYFSPIEIANLTLPALPHSERGIQVKAASDAWAERQNVAGEPLSRKNMGLGGGLEYHYSVFPPLAQMEIIKKHQQPLKKKTCQLGRDDAWAFFEGLTHKKKQAGKHRLNILIQVINMVKSGLKKDTAIGVVSLQKKTSKKTIYNWFKMVEGAGQNDWLAYLVAHTHGRKMLSPIDEQAWEFIKADYLRAERPTFNSCYRRLEAAAIKNEWIIPNARTLLRRIKKDISNDVLIMARHGQEAWKQNCYPAQKRSRSHFHALEAVNADGHKFDVFTKWPDGTIGRPMMIAFQDLFSNKFLSWRIDQSENKESVRLAFGDLVEEHGIPERCYLDNGRAFTSKWLTGGTKNRYRYKVKEEDPLGIMTLLGVDVTFVQPYAGQSKPIERAFRDMCDDISKDPRLAGAWTGNHIANKPENYGSKAIPIEEFIQIVSEGVKNHNARMGRRTEVCGGVKSFDQAFNESYAISTINKATEEQKRLWLLAAQGVNCAKRDGTVTLYKNRYWNNFLLDHKGEKLIVRFDPEKLHTGVHIYSSQGEYLGFAEIHETVGFDSTQAARKHNSARTAHRKATKVQLEAERTMGLPDMIEYMAKPIEAENVNSKIVKPIFGKSITDPRLTDQMNILQNKSLKQNILTDSQTAKITEIAAEINQPQKVVKLPETAAQRYQRALKLEQNIAAKKEVKPEDILWLGGYQTLPEYRAEKMIAEDFREEFSQRLGNESDQK